VAVAGRRGAAALRGGCLGRVQGESRERGGERFVVVVTGGHACKRGTAERVRAGLLVVTVGVLAMGLALWLVSCVWPLEIVRTGNRTQYGLLLERGVLVGMRLEDAGFAEKDQRTAWGFVGPARGWNRVRWWDAKGEPWWIIYWRPQMRVHGLGVEVVQGEFATPFLWQMRRLVPGQVVQIPLWLVCGLAGIYPGWRWYGRWRRGRWRGFAVEVKG
jgi:hypothetical protein